MIAHLRHPALTWVYATCWDLSTRSRRLLSSSSKFQLLYIVHVFKRSHASLLFNEFMTRLKIYVFSFSQMQQLGLGLGLVRRTVEHVVPQSSNVSQEPVFAAALNLTFAWSMVHVMISIEGLLHLCASLSWVGNGYEAQHVFGSSAPLLTDWRKRHRTCAAGAPCDKHIVVYCMFSCFIYSKPCKTSALTAFWFVSQKFSLEKHTLLLVWVVCNSLFGPLFGPGWEQFLHRWIRLILP